MIVNCPKCKFEQPNDEYCAQCGGPLRKLVEIEKQKKQNASNIPIYITTFVFFVVAGIWLSTQFDKEQEEFEYEAQQAAAAVEQNSPSEKPAPTKVVVSLKSAKIKINRDEFNNENNNLEEESDIKVAKAETVNKKSLTRIKNQSLDSYTSPTETKQAANPSQQNVESVGPASFKKLAILSTKNCDFNIDSGALNQENLTKIRSCASVISTKSFNGNGEIVEQGESFETLVNWSVRDDSLQIDTSFSSETSEGSSSESVNLNILDNTKGFIISNPFLDLIDRDNLKEDAKINILNSSLFGFSDNATQVYFLLSE